jgi:hypothetical protein
MALSTVLWLASAPLLVAAFAGLVVSAVLARDNLTLTVVLGVAALLALLLRLRMRAAGARARILSGNTPFGCFHAPTTPDDFAQRLYEVWRDTGRRPTVVGSGWGFFIGRAHARNAVFTHRLKGRFGEAFLAGTELREAEAVLRKAHGRTFWSTPTMQRISIGSWLARSCHGNSGAAGKPSSYAAARVLVVDLTSPETTMQGPRWAEYAEIKGDFDRYPGQFVIAAVEFDLARMSENLWLQKRRTDVGLDRYTATLALREWLTPEAVLRVLFFGSARRVGIGVTYVPFDPAEDTMVSRRECGCCGRLLPHVDPHDCSAACMSMQLDTCSLVCGWYEKAKHAWRGVIRLSDANAFSPDPSWLGFPIIALLSGTVNYELIFYLPQIVAPTPRKQELRVQKLCNALLTLYEQIWGRSELRMGNLDKGLVFVDCITRERDASRVIAALKPHVHLQTVALHDSKFQGDGVTNAIARAGLYRETPRAVFAMTS